MTPRRAVLLLVRLVIGGLLLVAGALKLRDPTSFATEIANYQLLPAVAPVLAAILPALEVVIGAGLIFAPALWRRAAAAGALGLFVMFTGAVASAYFRRINIDCGCFGTGGGPIDALTLLRNLALTAGTLAVLRFDRQPAPSSPAVQAASG